MIICFWFILKVLHFRLMQVQTLSTWIITSTLILRFHVNTYRFWEENQERDLSCSRAILVSCCQDRAVSVSRPQRLTQNITRIKTLHTALVKSFQSLFNQHIWIYLVKVCVFAYDMYTSFSNILGSHGHCSKHTSCLSWKKSWTISTLQHLNRQENIIQM